MNLAQRKQKAKKLQDLIGDFIEVTLKTVSSITSMAEGLALSNSICGYVIDADEYFLYLGEDMMGYCKMIELEEIGMVLIKQDIPEELLIPKTKDDNVH